MELTVKIHKDGAFIFAEVDSLNIYGEGHTLPQALQGLGKNIKHFYRYYKERNKSELIGDALRLKEEYQKFGGILAEKRE